MPRSELNRTNLYLTRRQLASLRKEAMNLNLSVAALVRLIIDHYLQARDARETLGMAQPDSDLIGS